MFGLKRETVLIAITLLIVYICFISLFAKEDNNNGIWKIPIPVNVSTDNNTVEGYSELPDYSENFIWDPLWLGRTNKDCYNLNEEDCMKYTNCGLCLNNGKAKCIPGDDTGPLFKEGCDRWVHTNYRDRHLFGEKVVTIIPPHDYRYPDYEAWWPSPQSRATLF